MTIKLVSVIIPCYKNSSTLERAIKSVEAQTYSAIEIVVVNDASPETEAIESIISRHPRIIYIRNKLNLGLAGARNAGIQCSSGDYIAMLDADDEYHPQKIATQMKYMRPSTVLTCSCILVSERGKITGSSFVSCRPRLFKGCASIITRNTLNGAGIFAEKDLLLKYNCYDASLRSCEDWDLYLRLLSDNVQVIDIGFALYYYHYSPSGLSKNPISITKWETEVILRHAHRCGPTWLFSPFGMFVCLLTFMRALKRFYFSPSQDMALQIHNLIDILLRVSFLRSTARFILALSVFIHSPLP